MGVLSSNALVAISEWMAGMPAPQRLLASALVTGLFLAVLAGCGGAAKAPAASSTASHSAAPAKPTVPATEAAIQGHLYSVANGATSVHVKGWYTWARIKITVNVGLRQPGQIAGLIEDNGDPMSVIDVGGAMYAKITPGFAAYYHQSAACPALCGKYTALPRSFTHSLVRSVGVTSTFKTLLSMAQNLAKPPPRPTTASPP
jgi:hypothetical protein